jgi:hypothetical protein
MKIAQIQHFVERAARGARPAASGGEKAANRLAKSIRRLSSDLGRLDADAVEGACELLRLTAEPPTAQMAEAVDCELRLAATGRAI